MTDDAADDAHSGPWPCMTLLRMIVVASGQYKLWA